MRYEFYDSAYERFNADVHFIFGSAGIVLSPGSTIRERGEAALVGSIMTLKLVSDFVIPSKRLLSLGSKLKDLRKISPAISVVS